MAMTSDAPLFFEYSVLTNNNHDMPHFINAKQLEGKYKRLLAASSEERKKLWAITTIACDRFHVEQRLSFIIEHNGKTIASTSKIALAIKTYNKIQSNTQTITIVNTPTTILCYSCQRQDHCNVFLRNKPERPVTMCASYMELT